jgi:putative SOS response-associated peptidase YedK
MPWPPQLEKEKIMCGRFTLKTDIDTVAKVFGVTPSPSLQVPPRYNVAPTQEVVSILRNGTAHLDLLRWGLIPSWAKDESIGSRMINARAETLAEKASFKGLLRSKRCLVVADGFYEWKKDNGSKTPMYIALKNGEPFAFAGLWDIWKSPDGQQLRTCTIITTEPNELVASIHDRMPVILSADAREEWLDTSLQDVNALLPLLGPYPADEMTARAVSRLVNNPKVEGPELLV